MQFIRRHNNILSTIILGISLIVFIYGFSQQFTSLKAFVLEPRYDISVLLAGERLGIVVDQNMIVILVEENSVAEKNGIKIGDKLKSLYGKEVYNIKEASEHLNNIRNGNDNTITIDPFKEFPLEIERDGKQIPFDIQLNQSDGHTVASDVIEERTTSETPISKDDTTQTVPTATIQSAPVEQKVGVDANPSKQTVITTPTPVPEDMLYL